MTLTVTPLDATLGAVVTDVDLAGLDDDTWAEIHAAFLEHGVLVFPDLHPDEESQGAFARRFGTIEKLSPRQQGSTLVFTNQKRDGSLTKPDEQGFHIMKGNEGWHTDSTYMPLAAKASMLRALVVPPEGGETGFADMRAAWDALDEKTQARLEGLSAHHSLYYSQKQAGYTHKTDNVYGFHDKGAPLRPIVKTHPETGRKGLYVNPGMTVRLEGFEADESEALLGFLFGHATQHQFIYRHRWRQGDVVIWDNRSLMHYAVCDYGDQPPYMERTTGIGDRPV